MTEVSVVIVSDNTRERLRACLESLKATLPLSSEVIVIDNASRDGSARMVAEQYLHVRLVRNAVSAGFAGAANQGAALARGAYVLFLSAEALVLGPAVKHMIAFLESNLRYGAVAPRLVAADGTTRGGMRRFPGAWTPLLVDTPLERLLPDNFEVQRHFAHDFEYGRDGDVEHAPLTCLLMRRKALKREKLLDSSLGQGFADLDLCKRLWEGSWRIGYLAEARVLFHGDDSVRPFEDYAGEHHRNRMVYYRKHHGQLGAWWVKACIALAVIEHCVCECYRRAEGLPEEPLLPVWESFTGILRT